MRKFRTKQILTIADVRLILGLLTYKQRRTMLAQILNAYRIKDKLEKGNK